MKRIYWRPPGVSRPALLLVALLSVAMLVLVETFVLEKRQRFYQEKLAAATLSRDAMLAIKSEKLRRKIPIDAQTDPAQSGLIGTAVTPVTSNTGYLHAKRTSVNPNFAAILVDLLKRAGVGKGDAVAVGLSGSFPAINISAFAALQVLELKPIVISSAAASEWGANDPAFLWLDMERVLVEKKLFHFRSTAASLGGIDDRGFGISEAGRALLEAGIARSAVSKIDSSSLADAIERRMQVYDQTAGSTPIRAYLNIGGGSASVGTHVGKKQFKAGLNRSVPRGDGLVDSVMLRFLDRGVPVIHVTGIAGFARRYGLPIEPASLPRVGDSKVFVKAEYNRWLALGGIAVIFGALFALVRLNVASRFFSTERGADSSREVHPGI